LNIYARFVLSDFIGLGNGLVLVSTTSIFYTGEAKIGAEKPHRSGVRISVLNLFLFGFLMV